MPQLKPLSKAFIPEALDKAKHYRLLNEPWQAQSICRDILQVDPTNQPALLNLILALTDQFSDEKRLSFAKEAEELCGQLKSDYEQSYYQGIIAERLGKAILSRNTPRVKYIAYEHYRKAMEFFEDAQKIQPKGNHDSLLRWNSCVRRIQEFQLKPAQEDHNVQPFLDI